MPRLCLCCGYPTGLEVCLACRGVLPRRCLGCGTALLQVADDFLCADCAAEAGPGHWAEVRERRAVARTLRTCDDCGLPMLETNEPICGYCQWQRDDAAAAHGRPNLMPPSIGG